MDRDIETSANAPSSGRTPYITWCMNRRRSVSSSPPPGEPSKDSERSMDRYITSPGPGSVAAGMFVDC